MPRTHTTVTGWKVFLTPGWVLTAVLAIAFSYFAIMVLSPWQLGKDHAIVERNEKIDDAFKSDPASYQSVYDAQGRIKDGQEWMRVSLKGRFDANNEVLLRMRPVEGTPAYQSLVPFTLESGESLLINRGFVPGDAANVPELAAVPTETVTIVAHARANEGMPASAPMSAHGYQQVYGINTTQISEITHTTLGTDFAQLSQDQPGVLNAMPIPQLDRGNHLSYGLQWIAFGIMAPLGVAYFVWAEIRERRRSREEEEHMAQLAAAAEPETPEDRVATKMRNRYGSSRHNQ